MFTHYLKNLLLKNRFNQRFLLFFRKLGWRCCLFLTLLFTVPAFFSLLRPGFFSMQDDLQAFRIYEMDKCFSDFQIPCRWVPDAGYGYGYPQFNYYAPFVYYLGEIIHLVGFQFIDAVKILFVLGFLVGAFGIYTLIASITTPFIGFVSAILFTFSPFRAQEVYVRGSLSEFWAVSLFPIVLYLIYRLVKFPNSRNIGFLAVSIGVLTLTHNLLPFIFVPIAVFWSVFWARSEGKFNVLVKVFLGSLIGVGIASFFLIPMLLERGFVHVDSLLSGYFDYRRHFVSLKQIFLSNKFGYGSSDLGEGDDLSLNIGLVLLYSALASIPLALLRFKKEKKYSSLAFLLIGILISSLFLMHLRSSFLWEVFMPLVWLQFPWRFLAISILVSAILAGITMKFLGFLKFGIGLILIILVFSFHGSFFQPKDWFSSSDDQKFSGESWERQLTISIFDYLPISAELPPKEKANILPEILSGEAIITDFEKGSNFQRFNLEIIKPANVRVQLYDFPEMKVSIDGRDTRHFRDCENQDPCLGLVSFDISEGNHSVLISLENTFIRSFSNITSLLFMGLTAVLISRKKHE